MYLLAVAPFGARFIIGGFLFCCFAFAFCESVLFLRLMLGDLLAVCVVAGVLLFGFLFLVLFFLSFVFDVFIFLWLMLGDLLAGLVTVLFLAPCFYFYYFI